MKIFIDLAIILKLIQLVNSNEFSHPGHGKQFGSSGPFLSIDETEDLSTVDFFEKYVQYKKPVLIRNGARQFPAFKLWSDEYLFKKSDGFDDTLFDVETVKKESRNQQMLAISFKQFLNSYARKELYLVNEVPIFLNEDVILPQPLQCEHANKAIDKIVISNHFEIKQFIV